MTQYRSKQREPESIGPVTPNKLQSMLKGYNSAKRALEGSVIFGMIEMVIDNGRRS